MSARSLSSAATPLRIAVYPGDGIGIEVTAAAFRLLEAMPSVAVAPTWFPWGCDYADGEGEGKCAPEDMIEQLSGFDAVFLGAVGMPERMPDGVTLEPLIRMRQAFDQYACVRPARTYAGVPMPLAADPTIDMVVVRENSEGEYSHNGGFFAKGKPNEIAVQTAVHTRSGVERVLRHGFELASTAERRQKLTMITKSNAQRYGMVLWDEILEELAPLYPHVQVDKQHIDAASMNFVLRPESFDVVVASNLFGDILTDLSGAITGSLGLNPSANLCPSREFPSLFEPVHGSAPDIFGKRIANPTGAFLSAAMMLEWLHQPVEAAAIRKACEAVLARGATPDAGGSMTTEQVTDAVIAEL